jgi:hypothetical protein
MRNDGEISNFLANLEYKLVFVCSCDITSFSSETQNINNQGK